MYKTILLHIDRTDAFPIRQRIAIALAERHGAHLTGCAVAGIPPGDYAMAGSPLAPWPLGEYPGVLEEARSALQRFAEAVLHAGAVSFDTRVLAGHAGKALVAQGAFADLIITGQDNGAAVSTGIAVGIPDYVALHGSCPVLMVPDRCGRVQFERRIVVGWNGSLEAQRAVRGALPLLRDAALVQVAVVNPHSPCDRQAAADFAEALARHGVHAEVVTEHATHGAGEALLHLARSGGAHLIVAGAYGHHRFRELVAGGTTRTLLDNPDSCVMLTH